MNEIMNGKAERFKVNGKSKPEKKAVRHSSDLRKVEKWGKRYVMTAIVLSSGLNAWANVDMSAAESVFGMTAAAALGAIVPVLVWMVSKIAGHSWRAGRRNQAYALGAGGIGLLFLSIWHCAHAITLLTGGGLFLAILLAVGIDYNLVASEVASVLATQE